jgi:two-component system, OmpR family, phosphate regulon sensor histidine kinase PhoR
MSKKRTILETAISLLTLIIIYTVSAVLFYVASIQNTEGNLTSALSVAAKIFNGNDPEVTGTEVTNYFSDDAQIRISIITKSSASDYDILYDSKGMIVSEGDAIELDDPGTTVTRKSSYGYTMFYLAVKDTENPKYYVRAAIAESQATILSRNFLIYGTLIMAVLIGGFIVYRFEEYKKTIRPLNQQIQKMVALSGEEPQNLSQQDDLVALSRAIEHVSGTLDEEFHRLKDEQGKTTTILNSMTQGFLALSQDGKIILINKAALAIFHYQEEDLLSRDYHVLLGGPLFFEKIGKNLRGDIDEVPFDITLSGRIYEVAVMHLKDSWKVGTKPGFAVLLQDVTNERNVTKVKNDFFTNASHELKSPLTSILGYQEMIESGIITDKKDIDDATLKTIVEAKRMKAILSDMLVISSLENKGERSETTIDLKAALSDLEEEYRPIAAKADITLAFALTPLSIIGDKEDIRRLFSNLIDNAIKYNKPHGKITVAMEGNIVRVTDTGIGISEGNLPRIFERFYRVDNSKAISNVEGSGLGLAIVKHICDTYHYGLSVQSVLGSGTTFRISFRQVNFKKEMTT